jgi:hypothetical protein
LTVRSAGHQGLPKARCDALPEVKVEVRYKNRKNQRRDPEK